MMFYIFILYYKHHVFRVSFPQTLVLAKVTPKQFKSLPSPYKEGGSLSVDPDPLCSNIYSVSERILLLWLNHHYEQQRTVVWQTAAKGPSWFFSSVHYTPVNFEDHLTKSEDYLTKFKDHLTKFEDHLTKFEDHLTKFEDHLTKFEDHLTKFEDHLTKFEDHLTKLMSSRNVLR